MVRCENCGRYQDDDDMRRCRRCDAELYDDVHSEPDEDHDGASALFGPDGLNLSFDDTCGDALDDDYDEPATDADDSDNHVDDDYDDLVKGSGL